MYCKFVNLTKGKNTNHELICSENRMGKLCGNCTANHSVYYHSNSYKCGEESYCKYGILLYILSEILPLTIVFMVIIAFNISFTSGEVILFAQIFNIFKYQGLITSTGLSDVLYTMTNLTLNHCPFCLWKGARTLDIIAWKYVTIGYALFIIIFVYFMNTTNLKAVRRCWRPQAVRRGSRCRGRATAS